MYKLIPWFKHFQFIHKLPRIYKTIWKLNNKTGGFTTLPDRKLYFKGMVIKMVWHWCKDFEKISRTKQSSEIDSHTHNQLILTETTIEFNGEDNLFNKW